MPRAKHKPAAAIADQLAMPSVERMHQELATDTSIEDFFGKEGIFARLFATPWSRCSTQN